MEEEGEAASFQRDVLGSCVKRREIVSCSEKKKSGAE
jgi:hypothetical protein